MIHEVEVSNLTFNKSSEDTAGFKKYDINVELEEESSNDKKTVLKYSIDLTSNPKNSVINISGNTVLSGEKSEIESFLKQEEQKPPQVVSVIYQELFPLIYIISKNMKIPSPSHTISQNQILDSSKQENKPDIEKSSTNETKVESIENHEPPQEEMQSSKIEEKPKEPTNENGENKSQ